LKLIYLVVTQMFAWLGLAGRGPATKDVEILMLRHQLAVAQRRDPRIALKLTWLIGRGWGCWRGCCRQITCRGCG
jgi:hypothetical protein